MTVGSPPRYVPRMERTGWARRSRALSFPAAVLLATVLGCSPKIYRFDAAPQRLCPGQLTTLAWAGRGCAKLKADVPVEALGRLSSSGERSFAIWKDTTFTLEVHRFGSTEFARQEIEVFSESRTKELLGRTACEGEIIVASATLPPGEWDDLARVDTVRVRSRKIVTVKHGDREATLRPGSRETPAFRGIRVSGEWSLSSPLLPDEVCGDPAHHPPATLGLKVVVTCGP